MRTFEVRSSTAIVAQARLTEASQLLMAYETARTRARAAVRAALEGEAMSGEIRRLERRLAVSESALVEARRRNAQAWEAYQDAVHRV